MSEMVATLVEVVRENERLQLIIEKLKEKGEEPKSTQGELILPNRLEQIANALGMTTDNSVEEMVQAIGSMRDSDEQYQYDTETLRVMASFLGIKGRPGRDRLWKHAQDMRGEIDSHRQFQRDIATALNVTEDRSEILDACKRANHRITLINQIAAELDTSWEGDQILAAISKLKADEEAASTYETVLRETGRMVAEELGCEGDRQQIIQAIRDLKQAAHPDTTGTTAKEAMVKIYRLLWSKVPDETWNTIDKGVLARIAMGEIANMMNINLDSDHCYEDAVNAVRDMLEEKTPLPDETLKGIFRRICDEADVSINGKTQEVEDRLTLSIQKGMKARAAMSEIMEITGVAPNNKDCWDNCVEAVKILHGERQLLIKEAAEAMKDSPLRTIAYIRGKDAILDDLAQLHTAIVREAPHGSDCHISPTATCNCYKRRVILITQRITRALEEA